MNFTPYKIAGLAKGVGAVPDSITQQRAELLAQRELRIRQQQADERVAEIRAKIAVLDLDPLRDQLNKALAEADEVAAEFATKSMGINALRPSESSAPNLDPVAAEMAAK